MNRSRRTHARDRIRARYDEFELGSATVAVISDPERDTAWIISDVSDEITP